MEFTLDTCKQASQQNNLHSWVTNYLNNEGNNKKLAKFINETDYIYCALIEYPLKNLIRQMGPEENMPFRESTELWEQRLTAFEKTIVSGISVCPLIATDFWGNIHISDGTHRFAALKRLGYTNYWTIFFIKEEKNKETVLSNVNHKAYETTL